MTLPSFDFTVDVEVGPLGVHVDARSRPEVKAALVPSNADFTLTGVHITQMGRYSPSVYVLSYLFQPQQFHLSGEIGDEVLSVRGLELDASRPILLEASGGRPPVVRLRFRCEWGGG